MRLLIADDEQHMRQRLLTKMNWTSLGITEVILCEDGDLALQEIERTAIDILLTDIRMARMDGITLARKALQINPNIKIIIISAYDDKEYLKSAIDLHVVDYLEKPFSLLEAEEAVGRAVSDIEANRKLMAEQSLGHLLALSQLANLLCKPLPADFVLDEWISRKAIQFSNHLYYATLILQYSLESDEEWLTTDLYKQLYELLESDCCSLLITMAKEQTLLFHVGYDQDGELTHLAETFYDKLSSLLPAPIHLSVGHPVCTLDLLYQSYQEATLMTEQHFFCDEPILYHYNQEGSPYDFSDQDLINFQKYLKNREKEACRHFIETLYDQITRCKKTPVRKIKNYYFQLILTIIEGIPSLNRYRIGDEQQYLWEIIFCLDNLKKLNDYTMELLDACFSNKQTEASLNETISQIIDFIKENVANPKLSLQDIAKAHYMSVPYLCTYFKEKTGKTIKTYLTECRMALASDLLLNTDLRIAEVSEMTGYSDQNYFTKRFSRHYSVTPSQYREKNA